MKPGMKWTAGSLLVLLLVAGGLRLVVSRQARQATLDAQQLTQKTQVAVSLMPSDLVQVKALDLPQNVAISGTLKAVNTAWVKARLAGELQQLTVREGDAVKAGQVLARIDPTEAQARLTQARQQAQAAKAQVETTQRSLANNQALVAQGFISSTALESSQSAWAGAQATYAAAQSGVDLAVKSLDDSVLRAPIAGQIAQRLAQSGERMALDARILEIVDNSRLEIEVALKPADAALLKLGQAAQLSVEGLPEPVTAKVARINPSASATTRSVLAYLTIAPDPSLRQGLFAQGSLATGTLRALAVPLSAVRTDKPKPYVQVVLQNQVQHLAVEIGARSEVAGQTLVGITGVAEGSQVIGGSVGSLRVGTSVNAMSKPAGTP